MVMRNLAGRKFGFMTAIEPTGERRRGQVVWRVRCDCGVIKSVPSYTLTSGAALSCGCYRLAQTSKANRTHGQSESTEFKIWTSMLTRCENPNASRYMKYGGRGISICERWHKFENFLADMGPRPSMNHSIDRINNDGNYEPENCRWATRAEQVANRSVAIHIAHKGRTQTLKQWADELSMEYKTLWRRIKRGWSIADVMQQNGATK
jgi:hypothetical protein